MAKVKKETLTKIMKHILKDTPTEVIAKKTNCTIGTVRNVIEELRNEYGVKSKTGVATAYLCKELVKIRKEIDNLLDLVVKE